MTSVLYPLEKETAEKRPVWLILLLWCGHRYQINSHKTEF